MMGKIDIELGRTGIFAAIQPHAGKRPVRCQRKLGPYRIPDEIGVQWCLFHA